MLRGIDLIYAAARNQSLRHYREESCISFTETGPSGGLSLAGIFGGRSWSGGRKQKPPLVPRLRQNQKNCAQTASVQAIAFSLLLFTETWMLSGFFLSGVPGDRSSSLGWK